MNDLQDFWNKSTARIPNDKNESIYAIEREQKFPRSSVICDLGGGTGTDSLYFASKGHQVILVDIASEALLKANANAKERNLIGNIKTVQCDLSSCTLPLENESCDVVYARLALHYFESRVLAQLFVEIYRILRIGGRTYLSLKSPDDATEIAFLSSTATEKEEGVFNDGGHIKTRYSARRLAEILADSGLPDGSYDVSSYTEKLSLGNDVIKSGNSMFTVNEVIIYKSISVESE